MCEKCANRITRICVALASSVYVAVETRKIGDGLSGLFSKLKKSYAGVNWHNPDNEEMPDEHKAAITESLKNFSSAEISEILATLHAFESVTKTGVAAIKGVLYDRYVAGERGMAPLYLRQIEEYIERNADRAALLESLTPEDREQVLSGKAQLIPISPEVAATLIATGLAEDDTNKPHAPGFGKMSPHVQ